ncbi:MULTISPECIES: hypothetical protein [Rhodococcus]|uniref:hypothetical protein n=1 Tax=Rhodococcus TaxID=1827 RepID=UPI001E56ADF8|nr:MULTISPECIES: hypothetical protein [Rhodococcus]BDB63221.1 hypothetical protein RDE2_50150 [Rhodococcus sp. RDE2]
MNEDEVRPSNSAEVRPSESDEMRPPYAAELLADLHAGALDDELAARLWPRVRRDPEAVAYLARLDATQARLSALRDAPPKESIPPEIAARIGAVLAEDRSVPSSIARRRRWAVAGAAVAAAVAVMLVVVVRGTAFGSDDPTSIPVAAAEDEALFEPSTLRAMIGDTDPGLLGGADRLRECLDANGFAGRSPIGSRAVRFAGDDAVLVLMSGPDAPALTALVVGTHCDADDPATIARKTIG